MAPYIILLSQETLLMLLQYKADLSQRTKPGAILEERLTLTPTPPAKLTDPEFLQLLLSTKQITCFAESEISGDGTDWNATELRILGDISVAMSVTVFDNGVWGVDEETFKTHDPPMEATLLFTPGPLLHGDRFRTLTPDLEDISTLGAIDQGKYDTLIKRRLLPVFLYAEETAKREGKKALIVLPGLGCGQFAGKYRGTMGDRLNRALQTMLEQTKFRHIVCVRYDPYNECADSEREINGVKYRVRRNVGPWGRPQLATVEEYEETEGEFSNCRLYKIVAWDHGSLPGNDYFLGSRSTDDGVAAAATNSMEVLTGVKGSYSRVGGFLPSSDPARTWRSIASDNKTKLIVDGNVKVATTDRLLDLSRCTGS